MTEPLFLGFDAGGSKTVCLVGDSSAILCRGESGPANPSLVGVAGFKSAIGEAARAAIAAAADVADGGSASPPRAAWIGVAGGETPAMRAALGAAAREVLDSRQISISHDARLILAAAGLRSGIAVVAGTGSSVYGRSAGGREVSVGGWGHLLGDEGSGYDLGRRALRAVTQAADGRAPVTRLSEAIPLALGVASVRALRERLYPAPPVSDVARLARVVLELAADDEVAAALVAAAARDLARAVDACREQLEAADPASDRRGRVQLPVAVAGGLLGRGSPLLGHLRTELEQAQDDYRVVELTAEPAFGALALARDGPQATEQETGEERMSKSSQRSQQEVKETSR